MSIADQVHDKILGLVLNQLAFSFGEELGDDVMDKLDHIINVDISYEAEIQNLLGPDSALLGYGNLMQLAEKITLEALFNADHAGGDEIADYIAKFPKEKALWLGHVISMIE